MGAIRMEDPGSAAVTEPVPDARRTMRLDRVFWSHFAPNLGPGGWVAGVLLVHLGLDLRAGIAAIVVGNLLGAVPVALAAIIGPVTGLPQMEGSRRVLGVRGLRVPAMLNWLTCIGWDAVNNVPAAAALVALVALTGATLPFAPALLALAAIQMATGMVGHDLVQAAGKYLGGLLLAAFAVIAVVTAGAAPAAPVAAASTAAAAAAGPTLAHLVLGTAIVASFNLSWAPYSSDYTRYLPRDTRPAPVAARALAGLLLSAVPFQLLGLLTAGAMGDGSPTAVIASLQREAGVLGPLVLAAIATSSITGNAFNDNTAAYSLVSAGIRVKRLAAAMATAAIGAALALAGHGHYADLYAQYLVVTLYWVAPWVAIVLADWRLDPGERTRAARAWTPHATLFVVVAVATILLFSSNSLYTGPVARALGGADIGYAAGFAAAWFGTVMLRRRSVAAAA